MATVSALNSSSANKAAPDTDSPQHVASVGGVTVATAQTVASAVHEANRAADDIAVDARAVVGQVAAAAGCHILLQLDDHITVLAGVGLHRLAEESNAAAWLRPNRCVCLLLLQPCVTADSHNS